MTKRNFLLGKGERLPRLQATVMIVLHKVVVGVAGKRQRIEPERIDRRGHLCGQPRAPRQKVLDIVAEDVMAKYVRRFRKRSFELVEPLFDVAFGRHNCRPIAELHRSHVKDLDGLWVDLQINRQTLLE